MTQAGVSVDSNASSGQVTNAMNVPSVQQIPKIDVVKLSASTYVLWKQQISLIIDGYGLLPYLSDDTIVPSRILTDATGQTRENPEYLAYYRQDKLLASWMLSTISSEVLLRLTGCTTTRAIWSTVTRMFGACSTTKTSSLRHSFHTQKKLGLSITEYLAKIKMICDTLNASGSIVSEQEHVSVILAGLSVEFESVIAVASKEFLSLEKLTEMLLDCEARMQMFHQDSMPVHANLVVHSDEGNASSYDETQGVVSNGLHHSTGQYQARGGNQFYSRCRRGGFNNNRGRGRGRYGSNRPQCQLCGRMGHTVQKCYYRFDLSYSGYAANGDDSQSEGTNYVSPQNTGPVPTVDNSRTVNPANQPAQAYTHIFGFQPNTYTSCTTNTGFYSQASPGNGFFAGQNKFSSMPGPGINSFSPTGTKQVSSAVGSGVEFSTDRPTPGFQPASHFSHAPMMGTPSGSSLTHGVWCPDSGASHHVTSDQSHMHSGVQYAASS